MTSELKLAVTEWKLRVALNSMHVRGYVGYAPPEDLFSNKPLTKEDAEKLEVELRNKVIELGGLCDVFQWIIHELIRHCAYYAIQFDEPTSGKSTAYCVRWPAKCDPVRYDLADLIIKNNGIIISPRVNDMEANIFEFDDFLEMRAYLLNIKEKSK